MSQEDNHIQVLSSALPCRALPARHSPLSRQCRLLHISYKIPTDEATPNANKLIRFSYVKYCYFFEYFLSAKSSKLKWRLCEKKSSHWSRVVRRRERQVRGRKQNLTEFVCSPINLFLFCRLDTPWIVNDRLYSEKKTIFDVELIESYRRKSNFNLIE